VESSHGAVASNPKLCAGCHMNAFPVTDPATGQVHASTGHTFEAIPCLDENGKPIVKGTCGLTSTQRTFKTCTAAGCHGSEGVARSATATVELRIQALTAELDRTLQRINTNWRTCRNNNSCAPFNGQPSPVNFVPGQYTTANGAAFNYDMGVRRSASIHNPLLVEALLITSIQQLRIDYNLPASSAIDLTPQFSQH
jgi:hypothetical protein